ncbi:DUF3997 domain-containing protein [Segetibacter aerophilus]|uniref:DUF3997 domain-containing protein n=1 Tax=Segetibacter aerophilus TaxID=670293 RepID=A0A512BC28_9BACT|nr:DUF3997 domain-containing protein [Segetibacter aerophilus]GEO09510.1 hypothetical protein SAE01_20060 [Segetibacter aerophilus]
MFKPEHYVLILCCLLLTSCFFDSRFETIKGEYQIGWIDVSESRAIYNQERLITPYVFAVGHNSRFIIAKQHPSTDFPKNSIDKSITNYFAIDMSKNPYPGQDGIYGPMPKAEFDNFCNRENINNIEFDMTYDGVP